MPDDPPRRGAKALSSRDWLFGSRPRRKLLEAVLCGPAASGEWTRPQLADLAGVVANGGADEHLDGLARLGLLAHDQKPERLWRAGAPGPLCVALHDTLVALADVPDTLPERTVSPEGAGARLARVLRGAERALLASEQELGQAGVTEILGLLAQARAVVASALGEG